MTPAISEEQLEQLKMDIREHYDPILELLVDEIRKIDTSIKVLTKSVGITEYQVETVIPQLETRIDQAKESLDKAAYLLARGKHNFKYSDANVRVMGK